MKVVLFCGGFGMRMREYSEAIPKPMVNIGNRPILWHVMKYYAHYGYNDFILCLGWNANAFKRYFLEYDECISNDFVFSAGGGSIELLNRDIDDWKITFVDTGLHSNIGERLKAVEHLLKDEKQFLANYTDGLSDVNLPQMVEEFEQSGCVGSFLSVSPSHSFHSVEVQDDGLVKNIQPVSNTGLLMNGGFFVFKNEIFDYISPGDELVEKPFDRLIAENRLHTHVHRGFWGCMDTFKEKQALDDLYAAGDRPWAPWEIKHSAPPLVPENIDQAAKPGSGAHSLFQQS